MREVLSARSSILPSRQKCQASLCAMVASVIPLNKWLASLTSVKNSFAESSQSGSSAADLTLRKNRIGVGAVEGQKIDDVFLACRSVAFVEVVMISRGIDQRLPLTITSDRVVQHQLKVNVDESSHVFGPFNITAHPVY